ncbi:MAG: hypothetical protein ABIH50_06660 [bacterium]
MAGQPVNQSISELAQSIVSNIDSAQNSIMSAISNELTSGWDGGSVMVNLGGPNPIDVTSALGSLVLSDTQEKSRTASTLATQFVSTQNQVVNKTLQTLA